MPRAQMTTLLLSLATLCVSAAYAQDTNQAVRDSASTSALNYVQGQATLDGQSVATNGNGAPRPLHAGDVLATANGSADVMLARGALLRVGNRSSVQVVADSPERAEVRLDSGRANVAVNMVPEGTLLLVDMPNGQTQLLKSGLYTFDTQSETMRVYHGEADAFQGANTQAAEKPVKVKEGHELVMSEGFKPGKFDEADNADLLPWTGPQETRAALADGAVSSGYAPVAYGYGAPYGYGFGDGYGYGYGPYYAGYPYWGSPYGFYGYPFFGFGIGYFGGGFYGRGYGYRGGYVGGVHGGYGGGFRGAGFTGGGGRRESRGGLNEAGT